MKEEKSGWMAGYRDHDVHLDEGGAQDPGFYRGQDNGQRWLGTGQRAIM